MTALDWRCHETELRMEIITKEKEHMPVPYSWERLQTVGVGSLTAFRQPLPARIFGSCCARRLCTV